MSEVEVIKLQLESILYSIGLFESLKTYITIINLGAHSKKHSILLSCLVGMASLQVMYTTNIIISFTNNSYYIVNVLLHISGLIFIISTNVSSFILMERTVILSDMTKYKKIFYMIHAVFIIVPYFTYSIVESIAQIQSNFDLSKLYLNELFIKYASPIGVIFSFTITINNLIGNYYLIKFYRRQGNLSRERHMFLESIIYSRIRFIILGIIIDILGIIMYILSSVGFLWAIADGTTNLGIVIQCIVLIEFINYDVIVTRFNITYFDMGQENAPIISTNSL